ncbi:MAG TPA: DinB family protein [Gemmatimonadaceae bacterium]|nr:DinB family protein [Gemmatimonadaceae bacterium]
MTHMITDAEETAEALRQRPAPDEYAQGFAGYIARVPDGDVLVTLTRQLDETATLLGSVAEERGSYRYASGKWSIKDVAGHMLDTERIMAYRALRAARGDRTELPGFEQDDFVRGATFDRRPLRETLEEMRLVRLANISFFRSLSDDELLRRGVANGNEFTPRAMAFIIAGHERHHLEQLRVRYGLA